MKCSLTTPCTVQVYVGVFRVSCDNVRAIIVTGPWLGNVTAMEKYDIYLLKMIEIKD